MSDDRGEGREPTVMIGVAIRLILAGLLPRRLPVVAAQY
jgi:hypothetical protein